MKLWSLQGNSQKLDGRAGVVAGGRGPYAPARAGGRSRRPGDLTRQGCQG